MLAKLPGCGRNDIIDIFDFRKPDFAASSFYSCTARVKKGCVSALVSKSGHCGLFVKEFENKGSVHWLRQGDKDLGRDEFLKRAHQQAADERTPGFAFSASGSLGIRRPAGMASSTCRVNSFRRGTLRSQLVSFLNTAGWRDTEVVSASMRKNCMMTLVRARPPCNALQAPWCFVMPQGDVITVDNWCQLLRASHWSNFLILPCGSLPKSLRRRQPSQWRNEMFVL